MNETLLHVGIVSAETIKFCLNGFYMCDGQEISGCHTVTCTGLTLQWQGKAYTELVFEPEIAQKNRPSVSEIVQKNRPSVSKSPSVSVEDVVIGVDFHWERKMRQTFSGALKLVVAEGKVCAINVLPVEDYLLSVISSEMSSTSSLQLLKAHAVISRSWVLRMLERARSRNGKSAGKEYRTMVGREMNVVKWYDADAHTLFDVCADDHCQRYQGIGRVNPVVAQAIEETRGEVLMYGGEVCDARFSKCCGGVMEEFQNCWENEPKPYLVAKEDRIDDGIFCDTNDKEILSQVLNGYDQETADFYRWTVRYSREQLSELVSRKSGIDFGMINDLVPIERGSSYRIISLKIVGEKCTVTVGKELEIRKWLSESHLYSSAFDVEKIDSGFILHGRGWGHGVGLCQIGAAVMGAEGYDYKEILQHYYPNSIAAPLSPADSSPEGERLAESLLGT